jgi:hypothetical protein
MIQILEQNRDPLKQELAVSVLTVMGQNCMKYPEVLAKFQSILASESHPGTLSGTLTSFPITTTSGIQNYNQSNYAHSNLSISTSQSSGSTTFSKDKIRLLLSTIGAVCTLQMTNHDIIKSLFILLQYNDLELRRALLFSIRQLTKHLKSQGNKHFPLFSTNRHDHNYTFSFLIQIQFFSLDELRYYEQVLSGYLQSTDGYLRETSLKLLRSFGRESVKRLVTHVLRLLEDQEHYCRRQALKTLGTLIGSLPKKKNSLEHEGEEGPPSALSLSFSYPSTSAVEDYNSKVQALQYLPAIIQRLGNKIFPTLLTFHTFF